MSRKILKQHHIGLKKGDIAEAVLLPGDPGRCDVIAGHFSAPLFKGSFREFKTFTGSYEGIPVSCTSTGIGCPSSSIAMEELINIGGRVFVRVGTCGAMQKHVKPGDIVIAEGAIRGDGTSLEYIRPEYPAVADFSLTMALKNACRDEGVRYYAGIIRSHDAFYAESPFVKGDFMSKIKPWVEAGTLAVENESSLMFVLGRLRKVKVATILLVMGNLLTREEAWRADLREKWIGGLIDLTLKGVKLYYEKWKDTY